MCTIYIFYMDLLNSYNKGIFYVEDVLESKKLAHRVW